MRNSLLWQPQTFFYFSEVFKTVCLMTDIDPEDYPAPQTPARDARAEPHSRHRRYDVSTSNSSPSISPSPSLSFLRMHPLGMSPFSPLSRQFSSPFAAATSPPRSVSEDPGQEDLTQDSKDVLIQRLNDLAARLNHQDLMTEGNVLSLHTKVDEMENLLATHYSPLKTKSPKHRPSSSALGNSRLEVGSPLRPSTPNQVTSDQPSHMQPPSAAKTNGANHDDKQAKQAKPEHVPKISAAEAERVVAEAQLLHKGLEEVIANLRARQEESDHIHDLLITRAERAAQRILFLERRVKELESERNEVSQLRS
ncbi:hypothetical protein F4810DRAFT_646534 [Camillea tinctor]|nr:hypothetical protein F4810DRAFT_646534 [Camillea tinctor]